MIRAIAFSFQFRCLSAREVLSCAFMHVSDHKEDVSCFSVAHLTLLGHACAVPAAGAAIAAALSHRQLLQRRAGQGVEKSSFWYAPVASTLCSSSSCTSCETKAICAVLAKHKCHLKPERGQ